MNAPTVAVKSMRGSLAERLVGRSEWALTLFLLTAVAIATRGPQFGNPVAHLDDQFYLLVGRSILEGQYPYVDIWDRKPLGLFVIYAAIAWLGGDGVVQTQLVAGVFAVLTAFVISRIGNRIARFPGGTLAGAIYLIFLPAFSGGTGQSPVFYNLFVSIAALICVQSLRDTRASFRRYRAIVAMLLVGIAMSIKPTALFEGCWLGISFLYLEWRSTASVRRVVLLSLLLVGVALIPVAAPFAYYATQGHLPEIWQSTVTSVLNKKSNSGVLTGLLAVSMAVKLAALVVGSLIGTVRLWARNRELSRFFIGWQIAALLGVCAIPNFFDHYALPALVPLAITSSVVLSSAQAPFWFVLLAVVGVGSTEKPFTFDGFDRAAKFEKLSSLVRQNLKSGCLYVYEGPVHLYNSTGSCRLTRFVFPDHLNSEIEHVALPTDTSIELKRILAGRPTVIVDARRIFLEDNLESRRILTENLRTHYRLTAVVDDWGARFRQPLFIWTLKTKAASGPALADQRL